MQQGTMMTIIAQIKVTCRQDAARYEFLIETTSRQRHTDFTKYSRPRRMSWRDYMETIMTAFTKMIKSSAAVAVVAAFAAVPTTASAQDVSVSTGVDIVTDYVFRGVSLADTAVQPFAEASVGNFTFGAWASTGLGDTSVAAGDEIDLYASYSFAVSDDLSLDAGITYYHYPQGGSLFETEGGGAGTYEVSLGTGFDMALSPSIAAYYDLTLEAFTLEGGIGHSIPMSDKTSFDLGATVGLVDGDGFSYEYGSASAALGYALADNTSAYVGGNFAVNSEDALNFSKTLAGDPKGSLVWFGAGISAGF